MHIEMPKYHIVRTFQDPDKRSYRVRGMGGLTLEEAQAHCKDPETIWKTCTGAAGKRRTRQHGPWSDGYEEEK